MCGLSQFNPPEYSAVSPAVGEKQEKVRDWRSGGGREYHLLLARTGIVTTESTPPLYIDRIEEVHDIVTRMFIFRQTSNRGIHFISLSYLSMTGTPRAARNLEVPPHNVSGLPTIISVSSSKLAHKNGRHLHLNSSTWRIQTCGFGHVSWTPSEWMPMAPNGCCDLRRNIFTPNQMDWFTAAPCSPPQVIGVRLCTVLQIERIAWSGLALGPKTAALCVKSARDCCVLLENPSSLDGSEWNTCQPR